MSRSNSRNVERASHQQSGKMQIQTTSIYAGPLPAAEELKRYEEIQTGLADRIVRMAEEQGNHRREIEKLVIEGRIRDSKLGILCGMLIGVFALGVGGLTTIYDHPLVGLSIGGGGVAGLVGVFVYGTRSNRKEREEKNLS